MPQVDAVIVGSGPNGLSAAITLARAGSRVIVFEAKDSIGGGVRTQELTLPGFKHDVCSAIHPLGVGSPFFRDLPLEEFGLRWIYPPAAVAHPLDDGTAVLFERSLEATASQLGRDAGSYRRLLAPFVSRWEDILEDFLGPFPFPPKHPITLARFGLPALLSAGGLARLVFREGRARAAFAGLAAHSIMRLNAPITASFGLVMGVLAHTVGWPLAEGGSQSIVNAMAAYLRSLGGEILTAQEIHSLGELPSHRAALLDVTPRQVLALCGEQLPPAYRQALERYRYGPGVFKVDYALDAPVPWKAESCLRSAAVHLGGTLEEIEASEREVWEGQPPKAPYVLFAQQSLFDPSRAPQGKHTAWAYCHVPNGSTQDMSSAIEDQIERFAPGFRSRILMRTTRNTMEMQAYNPNYIGGDINGGVQDLRQLFTRPVARAVPYSTPLEGVYLCSSSTPPGGGVHGMCGYQAARAVLRSAR